MATKITGRNRLKKGDIVRYPSGNGWFVGMVARIEKGNFIAFSFAPDDEAFEKENGVDCYQRMHLTDLRRREAEVIEPIELILMLRNAYNKIQNMQSDLRTRIEKSISRISQ